MPAKKVKVEGEVEIKEVMSQEELELLPKIRITQDYIQYVAHIDISNIVKFSMFGSLDIIFSKLGLIIKRQFGYLGYYWGYGEVKYVYPKDMMNPPVIDADVSLNIYFSNKIDQEWLEKNIFKFVKIYNYLQKELWLLSNFVDGD